MHYTRKKAKFVLFFTGIKNTTLEESQSVQSSEMAVEARHAAPKP